MRTSMFPVSTAITSEIAEPPRRLSSRMESSALRSVRLKICFYTQTGKISGAEKVLLSVLSAINSKHYDAVLFAPESPAFESFCLEKCIRFNRVNSLKARYTLDPRKLVTYFLSVARLLNELRQHFIQESPDLVHANTTRAAIVATLATVGTRIPVLWHIHDIMPRHPISTIIRLLAVISGRNRIVAVSRSTAAAFVGKLPTWLQSRAPVEVVHNGIDTNLFTPSREGVSSFLQDIGLDRGHFRIGIVGQITPRKGHLELIRSFAPVFKTDLKNGRLLVVGPTLFNNEPEYLEFLRSEVARLDIQDHVLFLGQQNVPIVMKSLNVLVLNSSQEPFGLVVTEAMASGTPVVAARVGGVPEILEDGASGLLFAHGDMNALVSHVLSIARDGALAERLAQAARARVIALFDETRFQSKILALYPAG